MTKEEPVNQKFELGDYVWVKANAPDKYLAIESGDICGFFVVKDEAIAQKFDEPIGCLMYIVEAGCGEDLEVPEQYLEFETD